MSDRLALPAILALAGVLRLLNLGRSFDGDEILTVVGARQPLADLPAHLAQEAHPPLSYLLLHGWLGLGESEVWARLLFVVTGLAVCAATYRLARQIGDQGLARASALLVAIAPGMVWASQYARSYILGSLFATAAAVLFLRVIRSSGAMRACAGYAALSAAAVYTFYPTVLGTVAQGVYAILRFRRRPLLALKILGIQTVVALSLLPWLGLATAQFAKISDTPVLMAGKGFYLLGVHLGGAGRSLIGTMGLDPLFLGVQPISEQWPRALLVMGTLVAAAGFSAIVVGGIRSLRQRGAGAEAWFLAGGVLVPVLLANLVHGWARISLAAHYFVIFYPLLAILAAAAWISLRGRVLRGGVAAAAVVLLLVRATVMAYTPGEGWREIAGHVRRGLQAGDMVALFPAGSLSWRYYAPEIPQVVTVSEHMVIDRVTRSFTFDGRGARAFERALSPFSRVWLVTGPFRALGGHEALRQWFADHGLIEVDRRMIGRSALVLYVRRGVRASGEPG
ncbi:MAG: glycosyltransferase family 39 protein [Deltaproteobacteria bacterium]|nr:glycosyltransferase family 39 protein [Deltaproteobacteria bacterium]